MSYGLRQRNPKLETLIPKLPVPGEEPEFEAFADAGAGVAALAHDDRVVVVLGPV